jgi:hypothetical protein
MKKYHGNTVEYWKQNAEEDYNKTPISVLKYITVLEEKNNANTLLSAVFAFFKTRTCKHEFKGKEMQHRDAEGIVRWQCHKCKKVFAAEYGLKILENGKCIGEWS